MPTPKSPPGKKNNQKLRPNGKSNRLSRKQWSRSGDAMSKMVVLGKDADAERRLAALQVTSLQETVSRQLAQIESIEKRMEEAKRQAQEIAVKAIEGASRAKVLTHSEQIAMEQTKTRARPQSYASLTFIQLAALTAHLRSQILYAQ